MQGKLTPERTRHSAVLARIVRLSCACVATVASLKKYTDFSSAESSWLERIALLICSIAIDYSRKLPV